jgi:hypothetical protein
MQMFGVLSRIRPFRISSEGPCFVEVIGDVPDLTRCLVMSFNHTSISLTAIILTRSLVAACVRGNEPDVVHTSN